jgi:hypothetical protein
MIIRMDRLFKDSAHFFVDWQICQPDSMYTQRKPMLLALLFIFQCKLISMQGTTFPASVSHEPQSLEPVFKLRKSRIFTAGLYKRRLQTDHTSPAITDGSIYPIISAPGISDKSLMSFLELATNITRSIDIALQKFQESKPQHIPTLLHTHRPSFLPTVLRRVRLRQAHALLPGRCSFDSSRSPRCRAEQGPIPIQPMQ